jgi:hypothetical protein
MTQYDPIKIVTELVSDNIPCIIAECQDPDDDYFHLTLETCILPDGSVVVELSNRNGVSGIVFPKEAALDYFNRIISKIQDTLFSDQDKI